MSVALTRLDVPDAPWAQQPQETDEQFACFMQWLVLKPRPPVPAFVPADAEWAGRAIAYDQWIQIVGSRGAALTPNAAIEEMLGDALTFLLIEIKKWKHASLTQRDTKLRASDIVRAAETLATLWTSHRATAGGEAPPDLSVLSEEDRAHFVRIVGLLSTGGSRA